MEFVDKQLVFGTLLENKKTQECLILSAFIKRSPRGDHRLSSGETHSHTRAHTGVLYCVFVSPHPAELVFADQLAQG